MKRTTIEDVARKAGVGKVTVSYVLNGHSKVARISEGTQQRVREAADALSYRPNALARMLSNGRTDLLAVVFQRGNLFAGWSGFTAEVMRGVSTGAVELGYDLMLHTRDLERGAEADALADGRIDGALVLRDEGDPLVLDLAHRSLPCVRFFSRGEGDAPFVDADNYSGGRMATRHLLELGHRRIGMVRGPQRSNSSNDRYVGHRDALEGAGVGVGPERVVSVPSATSDLEPLRRLMLAPDRPTALFCWSDEVALAALPMLREMGLRVPEDVSLVGFDSLAASERSVPALTSVRQPIFEMACQATRLLAALVRGEPVAQRQILVPLSLDVRRSTAPPSSPPPSTHTEVNP